jgi:hypothetical protein
VRRQAQRPPGGLAVPAGEAADVHAVVDGDQLGRGRRTSSAPLPEVERDRMGADERSEDLAQPPALGSAPTAASRPCHCG